MNSLRQVRQVRIVRFRSGDRVKIAEGFGTVLHSWPLPGVNVSEYYTVRLDNGRLRIPRRDEITSASAPSAPSAKR